MRFLSPNLEENIPCACTNLVYEYCYSLHSCIDSPGQCKLHWFEGESKFFKLRLSILIAQIKHTWDILSTLEIISIRSIHLSQTDIQYLPALWWRYYCNCSCITVQINISKHSDWYLREQSWALNEGLYCRSIVRTIVISISKELNAKQLMHGGKWCKQHA